MTSFNLNLLKAVSLVTHGWGQLGLQHELVVLEWLTYNSAHSNFLSVLQVGYFILFSLQLHWFFLCPLQPDVESITGFYFRYIFLFHLIFRILCFCFCFFLRLFKMRVKHVCNCPLRHFMMAVFKYLSGNSSSCIISVFASVSYLLLQVQIFLVLCLMVIFNWTLDILSVMRLCILFKASVWTGFLWHHSGEERAEGRLPCYYKLVLEMQVHWPLLTPG